MPVCIGGMHRSGTSLITNLLHISGLFLGLENDLFPPKPENPNGFWENRRFSEINDNLLRVFDASWYAPPAEGSYDTASLYKTMKTYRIRKRAKVLLGDFAEHEPWGWKDPRNSLTFPFWRSLLPQTRVIICLRNPLEVNSSLSHRNGFSKQIGISLWYAYNDRLIRSTAKHERIVAHYDSLFRDPKTELHRILRFVDLTPSEEALRLCLSKISGDLRHHSFTTRDLLKDSVPSRVIDLYGRLCQEAAYSDH